ncbi:MAG: ribonuclease D [Planctomycetes bacterium]|nr:ribonuclease D [Planctomycetota bacterium]
MLIRSVQGLSDLAEELRRLGSFALDTEFIRENTYRPQLCLVQIAAPGQAYVVDPFLVEDLTALLDLVADPAVEKIVHAGEQDMEIFFSLRREPPRNVFDTQVAAALAGRGESISYGRLVEDLLGVRLKKVETYTDWAKRPLRPEQVEYALDDVKYLLELSRRLRRELDGLGRAAWLAGELRFYEERGTYEKDPETLYLKIRSAARLEPAELAVLRELAAWREEEAERVDRPRGRVILDEALVELARRAPKTLAEIGLVRGVHPQLVRRSGEAILRRVDRARRLPPPELPAPIERRTGDEDISLVTDLLEVALRARAAEAKIAPAYLASRRELEALARRELRGEGASGGGTPAVLTGWRREIAGEALLEILEGRSHVRVDRRAARVSVVRP